MTIWTKLFVIYNASNSQAQSTLHMLSAAIFQKVRFYSLHTSQHAHSFHQSLKHYWHVNLTTVVDISVFFVISCFLAAILFYCVSIIFAHSWKSVLSVSSLRAVALIVPPVGPSVQPDSKNKNVYKDSHTAISLQNAYCQTQINQIFVMFKYLFNCNSTL